MQSFVAFVVIAQAVLAKDHQNPYTESLGSECWNWIKEVADKEWEITEKSSLTLVQVGSLIIKMAKDPRGKVCTRGLQSLENQMCGLLVAEMALDLTTMQPASLLIKLAKDPKGMACTKYVYGRLPHGFGSATLSLGAFVGSMHFRFECNTLIRGAKDLEEQCRNLKSDADAIVKRFETLYEDGFSCPPLQELRKEMTDYVENKFPAFSKEVNSHLDKLGRNFLGAAGTGVAGIAGLVWGLTVFNAGPVAPIVGVLAGAAASVVSVTTCIDNYDTQSQNEKAKEECKQKLKGMREMLKDVKDIMFRQRCF